MQYNLIQKIKNQPEWDKTLREVKGSKEKPKKHIETQRHVWFSKTVIYYIKKNLKSGRQILNSMGL